MSRRIVCAMVWAFIAGTAVTASAQSFRVQCPTSTLTHPDKNNAGLNNAEINRDRNLRLQYLAGIELNLDDSAAIYSDLLANRRFPEDIFESSEGRVDSLREAIRRQR